MTIHICWIAFFFFFRLLLVTYISNPLEVFLPGMHCIGSYTVLFSLYWSELIQVLRLSSQSTLTNKDIIYENPKKPTRHVSTWSSFNELIPARTHPKWASWFLQLFVLGDYPSHCPRNVESLWLSEMKRQSSNSGKNKAAGGHRIQYWRAQNRRRIPVVSWGFLETSFEWWRGCVWDDTSRVA